MNVFIKIIDSIERIWALALFGTILSVMTLQIFCRYVLSSPLNWPEEVAVLLACYLTFAGVSIVHRGRGHMEFTVLIERLPIKVQRLLQILVHIVTIIIFVILTITSIKLQKMQSNFLYFAALPITKNFFTLPITICSISIILNSIHFMIEDITGDS